MADKLKGNLVVGQSGGPTAVINSSLAGVVEEAKKYSHISEIYGMLYGIEGVLNEDLVDLRKESESTIRGLTSTPSSALGSCRHKLDPEDYARILNTLRAHDIRYFFYIGGNDSMDTSHRISQISQKEGYELRVIGVPKTVDNDLKATDHSPGYGSVARWVATSTIEAGLDAAAIGIVDKVKIIEVMGRDTGWIAAATTLGKRSEDDPPHLTYVPEIPFNDEKFIEDIRSACSRLGFCVVTACEGLRDESGEPVVASKRSIDTDAFGHRQLGGVADYLCQLVASRLNLKARFDRPGTIQRVSMALASKVDLKEAYLVGQVAVKQAVKGETDRMITLVREPSSSYRCTTGLVELEKVANSTKSLPRGFINNEGNGMTEEFHRYAIPLVGDPLPEYVKLNKIPVPKKVRI
ncbi:MAG: 6-phosphofructokinase [Promethearchaeati archaeon SRVP18_Atabeyarchaeia-1]